MPAPRPPHTIELTIPHVLTDDQFDELEDLTFLHFEETLAAWPISLKITSTLIEKPSDDSSSSSSSSGSDAGGDGEVEYIKTETTVISVATSSEWDVASEERIRAIVRNILVEIMGGG
ncbi:hypothetical protein I317_07189 [Kwoniella heveanensis CBS 569]|uniref:Uncharacterized protein n=1 Tax=Kwoniella heveanensis BCC8398 TaxID=1296120 RepID=A0A1B9GWF5_9TREE|nr:hypothetical protein I316_02897 [Kwoniella heveanensis BCC8398]OCF39013.1 hypothetical protein I317_07189 [Kwoniella heveanensis CBS 569]